MTMSLETLTSRGIKEPKLLKTFLFSISIEMFCYEGSILNQWMNHEIIILWIMNVQQGLFLMNINVFKNSQTKFLKRYSIQHNKIIIRSTTK